MRYIEFRPYQELEPYIDAFWTASGDGDGLKTEKILPDGCVDLILNMGADCETDNQTFTLKDEKAYLVGPMSRAKLTTLLPETILLGIRFKPAAFSFFYQYASLHEIADRTIEFERNLSPDIREMKCSVDYLNRFFLNRLVQPKQSLLPIVSDIQNKKGQLNLGTLAQKHYTTVRQLERSFRQYIGISPREFINLVRYQYALQKIQERALGKSLLDIAFECGYYDHSHLTNEIKKFTGEVPSSL